MCTLKEEKLKKNGNLTKTENKEVPFKEGSKQPGW
jgi:hypothetical protein